MNSSIALQIEDADQQSLREALHEAHFAKKGRDQARGGQARVGSRGNPTLRGGGRTSAARAERDLWPRQKRGASQTKRPIGLRGLLDDGAEDRARAGSVAGQGGRCVAGAGNLQREFDTAKAGLSTKASRNDAAIGALLYDARNAVRSGSAGRAEVIACCALGSLPVSLATGYHRAKPVGSRGESNRRDGRAGPK